MKRLLLVMLAVLLTVVGCSGPAVPAPESSASPLGEQFQIALPRLTVDVDSEGTPSILGLSPTILNMFGVNTDAFKLPTETVQRLSEANVQHIELAVVDEGLRLWVNGEAMPFVQTDAASLQRAVDFLGATGSSQTGMLQRLLPILTRFGLDVILRIPVQPGADVIPVTTVGDARAPALVPSTDPASVIAKFEVKYDENGVPMIMGMDATGVVGQVLSEELIQKLQAGNVQTLQIRNRADGFTLYVNGEPLPTLKWDTALLGNAADFLVQMMPEDSSVRPLVEAFLPTFDRGDVDILIHLPLAPGVTPIPVKRAE